MYFRDIPEHLKKYVLFSEELFDSLSEEARGLIVQQLQRQYGAEEEMESSRRRLEEEMESSRRRLEEETEARRRAEVELERLETFRAHFPFLAEGGDYLSEEAGPGTYGDNDPRYLEMLDNIFFTRGPEILLSSIIRIRWGLGLDSDAPNRRDFVNMIRAELRRITEQEEYNPINVTLGYVTSRNRTFHRSFKVSEIRSMGLDALLDLLLVSEEDRDNKLFHGSDMGELIRDSTLFPVMFDIYCYYTLGGGKYNEVEYDYYVCANVSSDLNNCLIECFRYITNDTRDADRCRADLGLSPRARLGLKHVPLLEDYYHKKVIVVEDRRRIKFRYINGPDLYDLDSFRARIVKDGPYVIYKQSKKAAHKIVFKDGHFDVVVREFKARDRHCPYTGVFVGGSHLNEEDIIETLIEQGRMTEENSSGGIVDMRTPWYYFFDYETVYDMQTLQMRPYGWSLVKCDVYGNICDRWTTVAKGAESLDDVGIRFLMVLRSELANEDEKKYLIGFNNSRFDNFILLEDAIRTNTSITNAFFAGNSILTLNIGNFVVRDLYRILVTSLDKACKSFGCRLNKGKLEHDEVQYAYMSGDLEGYIESNKNKIREYVLRDCESLAELFFKTKQAFKETSNLYIEEYSTIASLTYRAFIVDMPIKVKDLPILDEETDRVIRQAIIGGRAEMFMGAIKVEKEMCCLDIVSLYPYVMMSNRYPVGQPLYTEVFVPSKIGVYEVEILSQPDTNIIPYRTKDSLDWKYKGQFKTWLTSIDIECLLDYDSKLIIHEGYYWEEDRDDLFVDYFRKLSEAKMQQDRWKEEGDLRYNPALRECLKLMMNALSGKLIQRLFTKHRALVKGPNEMHKFMATIKPGTELFSGDGDVLLAEGEKLDVVPNTPCVYGLLIYSYSRRYLYDNMISMAEEKYGTDTDSLFCTKKAFIDLKSTMPALFGNMFGQIKEELKSEVKNGEKGPFGIFIAPKCYCFYTVRSDGSKRVVKFRFKGVRIHSKEEKNNDKIITDNVVIKNCLEDKMPIKELHEIYYIKYKDYGPGSVDIDTFEKLLKGENIYVLCSNIDKQVGGGLVDTRVMLKQRFFIKEIKNRVLSF